MNYYLKLLSNKPFEDFFSLRTKTGKSILLLFYISIISCVVNLVLNTADFAIGDEKFYIYSANAFCKNSLFQEMANGNPVGYTYVLYLVSRLGLSLLVSGYVISLLSSIVVFTGIIIIARKHFGLKGPYLNLAAITILLGMLAGNMICVASDDMYYSAFFIWIIIYISDILQKKKSWQTFIISGVLMSATLIIRPLTYIYFLSTVLAMLFVFIASKELRIKNIIRLSAFISAFAIVFLIQEYPSLHITGHFAFENKMSDTIQTKANWVQKLTLTDIIKSQNGPLEENHTLASWKQCDDYLDIHGINSLPKGAVSRFFWNPVFTLKYFFIGMLKLIYSLLVHTGIVFILPFLYLFRSKISEYKKYTFLSVLMINYCILYLFEAINFIEHRHLILPYLVMSLTGVYFLNKMKEGGNKYANILSYLQLGALFIVLLHSIRFFIFSAPGTIFYN